MSAPAPGTRQRVMTPPGEGGISVIRLSGPRAPHVLASCFRPRRASAAGLRPGEMAYGHIIEDSGAVLDEVIVAALRPVAGRDEIAFEINCHGGAVATAAVARRLEACGAAPSDEPEPTWLPSDSPLARELSALLPRAWTPLAVRVICDQLAGRLAEALSGLSALADRPARLEEALRALLDTAALGQRLTAPAQVVIAGPPNAGKSTLMNRLLETERVLVYHQPGTTRDVVTELAAVEGLPILLSDTAGIAAPLLDRLGAPGPAAEAAAEEAAQEAADEAADEDVLAVLSVRAAWAEALRADLVLVVFDALRPPGEAEAFFAREVGARGLYAANKIDAAGADARPYETLAGRPVLPISAREGAGVDALKSAMAAALTGGFRYEGGPVILTLRQRAAVEEALHALLTRGADACLACLASDLPATPC